MNKALNDRYYISISDLDPYFWNLLLEIDVPLRWWIDSDYSSDGKIGAIAVDVEADKDLGVLLMYRKAVDRAIDEINKAFADVGEDFGTAEEVYLARLEIRNEEKAQKKAALRAAV